MHVPYQAMCRKKHQQQQTDSGNERSSPKCGFFCTQYSAGEHGVRATRATHPFLAASSRFEVNNDTLMGYFENIESLLTKIDRKSL